MPKTLMRSLVSELQKERTRLADELHRVTAALTAFGKVYMQGSRPKTAGATRKKRTLSAVWLGVIVSEERELGGSDGVAIEHVPSQTLTAMHQK